MRKLTQEEFLKRAKNIHNNAYDYSKTLYKNYRSSVVIICKKHGEFLQTAGAHLSGEGCPICGKKLAAKKHTSSIDKLLKKFKKVHGDAYLYDFGSAKKQTDYITITCKKHNYIFKQRICNHILGHGCPLCNGGVNLKTEGFCKKANVIHNGKYDYSLVNYVNKNTPVAIICKTHGVFYQKPHDHICGCGCPKCKIWKTQQKIYNFLCNTFPNETWYWEYSPDWLGLQRFDIYNKRINLAIEYNGEQHYMPIKKFGGKLGFYKRKRLDNIKKEKCKLNNCKLYIIKYNCLNFDKLKEDVNSFLKM